jgi:hypothetical protein
VSEAAFYCVSSERYFLGAVALVNSLRVLGHTEPVFVLDAGLSPTQREVLSQDVTVVPAPGDMTPFLLKTVAPLRFPAEVMVLVDADIIVTRPLTELIDRALEGRVLAVEHEHDRFFPQWGDLLGLGTAQQRRYVSSGLVLAGGPLGKRVIRLMHDARQRIEIERTPFSVPAPDLASLSGAFPENRADRPADHPAQHPFFFADQDILNAVLASDVDPGRIDVLDRHLEAITPFKGLKVRDKATLRCAWEDGTEPYAVHHYMPAKPWLEPTYDGVYSRLLRRLLVGADVSVKVPRRQIPWRLRSGLTAYAERKRINAGERVRWLVAGN